MFDEAVSIGLVTWASFSLQSQSYQTSAVNMKGILFLVFLILILSSGGIAKYLDDKRALKEEEEDE